MVHIHQLNSRGLAGIGCRNNRLLHSCGGVALEVTKSISSESSQVMGEGHCYCYLTTGAGN
jgi:hypothetical protein